MSIESLAQRPSRRHFLSACARLAATPAWCAWAGAALAQSTALAGSGLPWQPMLAREAGDGIDPRGYLVSEKLDGVRALWDGRKLWFRSGLPMAAPAGFLAQLPADGLDGELWMGRASFERLVGTVRRAVPDEQAWQGVRFMAFDMPRQPGAFEHRAAALAELGRRQPQPAWAVVQQRRVASPQALATWLAQLVAERGEGLMLHRADAPWHGGRSDALLKLKPLADAEAQVVAHVPGQGRHAGRLGALRVRTRDGLEFKLGTGFSDAQRDDPPPLGSWVTFTYRGLTDAGLPRFAAFLRLREPL